MRLKLRHLAFSSFLFAACGGSPPPAESASDAATHEAPSAESESASPRPSDSESNEPAAGESDKDKPAKEGAEPNFTENMSVDEAMKAVPQDADRRNIDQETLGKPLQDLSLYEPCKPGSAHVKMRVAVWNGKAVGVDVSAKPKSEKLEACVKERVRSVTWEKKVKSLNTIEYQF